MSENYKIYGLRIIGTEETKYVGRTKYSLSNRWSKHKSNARIDIEQNSFNYRSNWITKHKDEIEIFLIEENISTKEESCEKEIKYIEEYSKLFDLTNTTIGGDGGCEGYKHSAETRLKMSNSTKGIPRTWSSEYMKNRIVSEETRKKMSENAKINSLGENNPMYGKDRPDVIKRNKDNTGWKHTEETKNKMKDERSGVKNANYKTGKYSKSEKEKRKRIYKLTKENVIQIRELHNDGKSYNEISLLFNITVQYVSAVVRKVKWKNI